MPEKTSLSLNYPTRDLVREIAPSWMEYDDFMLELLIQYDSSTLHIDPRSTDYSQRLKYAMQVQDVDPRALDYESELVNFELPADATPLSP